LHAVVCLSVHFENYNCLMFTFTRSKIAMFNPEIVDNEKARRRCYIFSVAN